MSLHGLSVTFLHLFICHPPYRIKCICDILESPTCPYYVSQHDVCLALLPHYIYLYCDVVSLSDFKFFEGEKNTLIFVFFLRCNIERKHIIMLRSVWFFLSSLISKHILILFPKSNANFRHKLYKCGTALKIFCLFIFDVLTGVALFILLCQRMNIKSQLQFIMCKNWPSLQEEYNLTWMFYVDSKRAFAYTWAHTSYWWGLVTDGDCYQGSPAEITFQTYDSVRDYQGQENTTWSTWLRVHVCELQGYMRAGCLFSSKLSSKSPLIISIYSSWEVK